MNAKLQVLDAILAIVLQFTTSPDKRISAAATDELQELAKRRAKLLKSERDSQPPTEGASRETALAA